MTEQKLSIDDIRVLCQKKGISTKEFCQQNNVKIDTFCGEYNVSYIDKDCWVHCGNLRSWACHAGTLLRVEVKA